MIYLFFAIFLLIFIIMFPFFIQFEIKINIIKLKGIIKFILFKKIKIEIKYRIKHGFLYIYYKNKEKKEQISKTNVNLIFVYNMIKETYFRQQLVNLSFHSNFGYVNNSCVSAVGSGYIDVIIKSILSKIKNNKKKSHIFIDVNPKYNEDIFSVKICSSVSMSVFDLIYAFLYAKIYSWREYERNRKNKVKQRQKN